MVFVFQCAVQVKAIPVPDEWSQRMGRAMLDGFEESHFTIKEAAHALRWDESQLRKALLGEHERHLPSLTRLAWLPFHVFKNVWPRVLFVAAQRAAASVAADQPLRRKEVA